MRKIIDKILRASIKVCLLTGVAFTVTACYAPANPPEDPHHQEDQQKLEQQLVQNTSSETIE